MASSQNFGAACNARPSERIIYAIIAIIMLAFAVSFWAETIVVAVLAGLVAVSAVIMAITGFCWGDWLYLRAQQEPLNQHPTIKDARHLVNIELPKP